MKAVWCFADGPVKIKRLAGHSDSDQCVRCWASRECQSGYRAGYSHLESLDDFCYQQVVLQLNFELNIRVDSGIIYITGLYGHSVASD